MTDLEVAECRYRMMRALAQGLVTLAAQGPEAAARHAAITYGVQRALHDSVEILLPPRPCYAATREDLHRALFGSAPYQDVLFGPALMTGHDPGDEHDDGDQRLALLCLPFEPKDGNAP